MTHGPRRPALVRLALGSILGLIFAGTVTGCRNPPPREEPVDARFVQYFAESLIQAEESKLRGESDSAASARAGAVRERHGYSASQAESLLASHRDPPARWEAFLTRVLTDLNAREQAFGGDSPGFPSPFRSRKPDTLKGKP